MIGGSVSGPFPAGYLALVVFDDGESIMLPSTEGSVYSDLPGARNRVAGLWADHKIVCTHYFYATCVDGAIVSLNPVDE